MRALMEEGMDNLLLWLFLNARTAEDEQYLATLANSTLQTPATFYVKQITTTVQDILQCVGDCVQSSEAIKISLKSLTRIVKTINKELVAKSTDEKIGFDSCLKISKRSNQLFTKLLESWLVSDVTINYFCFDLQGFAFLLDTIGSSVAKSEEKPKVEESKAEQQKQISLMEGSDLDMLLKGDVKAEEHPVWSGYKFL